jgi:hypothetical protein
VTGLVCYCGSDVNVYVFWQVFDERRGRIRQSLKGIERFEKRKRKRDAFGRGICLRNIEMTKLEFAVRMMRDSEFERKMTKWESS